MEDTICESLDCYKESLALTLAKFTFYLLFDSPFDNPFYLGSTLRGGFGFIFKKAVCPDEERICKFCLLKNTCAYAYIFETPRTDTLKSSYRLSEYPHPYVIEPPLYDIYFAPKNRLSFDLILIGNAIKFLPYFVITFQELGRVGIGNKRKKYIIEKIEDTFNNGAEIYQPNLNYYPPNFTIKRFSEIREESKVYNKEILTLEFVTPTRIVVGNRLTSKINFLLFIKSLLRRISLISQIHCNNILPFSYLPLLEMASKVETINSDINWIDWERYSSRQKRRIKLGGFVGKITFEEGWNNFSPFIKLGEYIHIGKGTSFGLGKYEIL